MGRTGAVLNNRALDEEIKNLINSISSVRVVRRSHDGMGGLHPFADFFIFKATKTSSFALNSCNYRHQTTPMHERLPPRNSIKSRSIDPISTYQHTGCGLVQHAVSRTARSTNSHNHPFVTCSLGSCKRLLVLLGPQGAARLPSSLLGKPSS